MGPLDLMGWALGAIAVTLALAVAFVASVLFARFLEEQRANLATHRAKQALLAAEARAQQQRAELEAADILERRLALLLGGTSTSLGEHLEARMDQAAGVIKQIRRNQDAFGRGLARVGDQLAAVQEQRAAVVHTDQPLRAEEERQ